MKANGTKLLRWDGTAWEDVCDKTSVTAPEHTMEVTEEDETLDSCDNCTTDTCASSDYKKKSPGTKELGDLGVEVKWNPSCVAECQNHHLFEDDFKTNTATFWAVEYPNGNTRIYHAFVQTLGEVEIAANETVKREFTLVPTGCLEACSDDLAAYVPPVDPVAPKADWGA